MDGCTNSSIKLSAVPTYIAIHNGHSFSALGIRIIALLQWVAIAWIDPSTTLESRLDLDAAKAEIRKLLFHFVEGLIGRAGHRV